MVKWNEHWLDKKDRNDEKICSWASRNDTEFANCKLCCTKVKYDTKGFQALFDHTKSMKHPTSYAQRTNILQARIGPSAPELANISLPSK